MGFWMISRMIWSSVWEYMWNEIDAVTGISGYALRGIYCWYSRIY